MKGCVMLMYTYTLAFAAIDMLVFRPTTSLNLKD